MKPPQFASLCFVVSLCLSSAYSENALEIDFTQFDPATRLITPQSRLSESEVQFEASEQGASVDPGAKSGIRSDNPALTKGIVECVDSSDGGGFLDSTAGYSSITGVSRGFGTGTVAAIFQPHFSGRLEGEGASSRACFFATNYGGTSSEGIVFGVSGKSLSLALGIGSAASPTQRATITQPDWEADKWYFVASSWSPSEKPTIYWREVGSPNGFFAEAPEGLTDCQREVRNPARIGNAGNSQLKQAGRSSMKGKMAFFFWGDSYTDSQQAYDALYEKIMSRH